MNDLDIDEVRTHWQQSVRPKIANALGNLSQEDRWLFRRIFADRAEPETIADELDLESRDEGVVFVTTFKAWLANQLRKWGLVGEETDDDQVENLLKFAGADGLGQPRENAGLEHLEHLPGLDQLPVPVPAVPGENETHPGREQTRKIELKNVFREELLQRRLPWAGPAIEIVQKQKGEDKALFYVSAASRPETENSAPPSHLSSPMGLLFREAGQDQPQAVLLTEERPTAVVPETLPSDWGEVTLDLYIEPPELVEETEPEALLWIGSEFFQLQPRDTSEKRSWQVKGIDYEMLNRYRERQSPVRVEHPDLQLPTVRLDEFEEVPPGNQEAGVPPKERFSGRDRRAPRPVLTGHVPGWRLVFSSSDSSSVSLQIEEGEAEHSSLGEIDPALKDPIREKVEDLDSRDSFHPTLDPAHVLSGEGEEPLSPDEKQIDLKEELGSETVAQRLPRLNTLQVGRLGLGQEGTRYYVRSEGEEPEDKRSLDSKLELKLRSQEDKEEGTVEFSPGNSFKLFNSFDLPADWEKLTLILKLPPISDVTD
jgi:hypothetical protein